MHLGWLLALVLVALSVACSASSGERDEFIEGLQAWHGTWVQNGLVRLSEPYDPEVKQSLDVLTALDPPPELQLEFDEYLRAHVGYMYAVRGVENGELEQTLQLRRDGDNFSIPACDYPDMAVVGPSLRNDCILRTIARDRMMDVRWKWEREYFRPGK